MKTFMNLLIITLTSSLVYGQSDDIVWSVGSDSKFEINKIKPYNTDQHIIGGVFEDSLKIMDDKLFAMGDDDIFLVRFDSDYQMESFYRFGDSERETLHDYVWFDNSLYVLFSFYDFTRILDIKLTSVKRSRNYAVLKLSDDWEVENVWQMSSIKTMKTSTLSISQNQINLILASEDSIFVDNQLISGEGGIVNCVLPSLASHRVADFTGPISDIHLLQNDSLNFVCGIFEGEIEIEDSSSITPGTRFSNGFVIDFSRPNYTRLYEISSIDDVRLFQAKLKDGQLELIIDYISNLDINGEIGLFGFFDRNTTAIVTYSNDSFDQDNSYNLGFEYTVLSDVDIDNKRFSGSNYRTNEGFFINDSMTTQFVGKLYAECLQSVNLADNEILVLIETDRQLLEPKLIESSLNGNVYLLKLAENLNTSNNEIQEEDEQIYIYPNPTSSHLNIVGQKWSHCELYNMQAQLIQGFTYNNIINISNVISGKYLLVVYSGHKKLLSKVVIKL